MEADHVKRNAESQRLLQQAREKGCKKSNYDWEAQGGFMKLPHAEWRTCGGAPLVL
jgi:hypothetical protein